MNDTLVIFDLDGTLCDTFEVDDECFSVVASEILDTPLGAGSWEAAPHVSDQGILNWLWLRHRDRLPTARECDAFIEAFALAMSRELDRDARRFKATAGANQVLNELVAGGCGVAIATGGWSRTARLKLSAAGLPQDLLLASCDDSQDRVEIFDLARRRYDERAANPCSRTVLVGDGVWDVRVSGQLGWPFVGIGRAERAARLRDCGAAAIVEDFTDTRMFLQLMQRCEVPPRHSRHEPAPVAGCAGLERAARNFAGVPRLRPKR
jgi:phosphoglycolate phosphatase-like HAD superfamily hydrolase